MERIYAFLPSVLVIACIAGATLLYMKWVIKRFGDNFKSVEWHKKNQWKVVWTVSTPLTNVWAPAVEELIFRAPLIIAFSAMSSVAWYGVFASSGLFALTHWFGKKIWIPEILSARENGDHKSDDVMAEVDRLHQEAGKRILVQKVFHVVFTLPLGILAGYYGIKYQSVWVAFGIHSVWNLVMPAVLPILMFLGVLAFVGISSLWDRVRWRRRRSW
ncbi:MAG: CPBP family intramembrane glutamic endopeptidase [Patescibacteria group bacterium]